MRLKLVFIVFLLISGNKQTSAMDYEDSDRKSKNVQDYRAACTNTFGVSRAINQTKRHLVEESPISELPPKITLGIISMQKEAFGRRIADWKETKQKLKDMVMKGCSYPAEIGREMQLTQRSISLKISSYQRMYSSYASAEVSWGR